MKESTDKVFKSTCSYCGTGCGVEVSVDKRGRLNLTGDASHPVNKGMLCSKGRNLHYTVSDHSDRLLYPQMRWSKSHPMQRTDWDTAIGRAAAVFKSLIAKYGPDSVGFYVSGQCLTEEYYLVNKLTKGFIGTNNIDTNSRLCMSSAVAAYTQSLGEDSVPISYEDIELADCFLIAGANPAWCHPILFRRLEQHKEQHPDIKVIVIDPRVTDSCSLADLHIQLRPGTDTVLLHAIGRCLIENGDIDLEFVQNHTDGYEDYKQKVLSTSLEEAANICDVPLEQIKQAASYIGNATGFITMWAMGLNQSTEGLSKNLALINLNLVTGHVGKPGSGPFSLTGQPNAMGGREVGGMATLLASHRNLLNPEHRKEVAAYWGVDHISDKPGKTATQMFEALRSGEMKAIWIICTNPVVSMPDARLVDEALKNARFVVVQDISTQSDTLQYADLVLPAAGWLEKEGTMTNSDRRISHLNKVVPPPGEALPDSEILIRFARQMGYHGFDYENQAEIYAEHCSMTRGTKIDISGLSYERLKKEGSFQWPVPDSVHPGTPRLFTDRQFYTASGKAQIKSDAPTNLTEEPTPDYSLILTTGRIRDQWHTMTRTGKVNKLKQHIDKPFLEIHPHDAAERGIKEGMAVDIENSRGSVQVVAKLTDTIKKGVVFLPMHWGKTLQKDLTRANNLTSSAFDPTSKQPGFKFSAVEVKPHKKPAQKIVIVGAGAAAYRFINTHRELNLDDEIHVFSKEEFPFYNRVLLPEYINDQKQWEDLLKFKIGEFEQLNVHLHQSNSIESIDPALKMVADQFGVSHSYDTLVMATGSRAFVPPDVPIHLPGIFTMRDRRNADELKATVGEGNHVVVVGGGLLGLELAAALAEVKIKVSIIQLSSRLMERQLDSLASNLLRQEIENMGIQVYTNDQVQSVERINEQCLEAKLKSGKSLISHAIVYAIGTRPNLELGKEAGLECGRGIKVNDYMQTSDPSIYALGEIAEHEGQLNGITAAAEKHADVLAHYLNGDLNSRFTGCTPMNILKMADVSLCSIGMAEAPENDPAYDEILLVDKGLSYYKKCIIHHDKLVGVILMGDKAEFAEFRELIENGTELSDKRKSLLRSGSQKEAVLGKLVCSCNNVGEGNIKKAIAGGCSDLASLCKATGAGLGCGSCKPEVKNILNLEAIPAEVLN
ncbi:MULTISPECIES: nitrate reductase [unclassified Imperialibacter]|uniref:nitrate reductase n=1 Tax=unclassified Imperialibacter TaxID=2629706 RepID=UPI00125B2601|nr:MULTISPECIES: nitrate reductase [unclassified Imperialibacter]CAD5264593.1 Ferredoxin-nitrate reductase [Imperialibacter sp. 89]CAD5269505.1 Ferredoxin-nitrate reductase [Imperialibacter sp. 75]VVT09124.1 Ferredoxin-nitrate reductase [Imperialibacter sp. EC-SDR9]